MSNAGPGIGFWHPKTQFHLHVVKRNVVHTTAIGSRLSPVLDVDLTADVVPDLQARQQVFIDLGLLEKLDLQFSFDDRGLLESLNSESGRDLAPVLGVVGKIVGMVAALAFAGGDIAESLEQQWDEAHPKLVSFRERLDGRVEAVMTAMTEADLDPKRVVEFAAALTVLEGYQSSLSQLRREWIAGQAGVVDEDDVLLAPADLHLVATPELPPELTDPAAPAAQQSAFALGALLVVADHQRPDAPPQPGNASGRAGQDVIYLRDSRPAQAGVYLRSTDDPRTWTLQKQTVLNLDLVDEYSGDTPLSLDGSWLRTKKFTLAYHPDKSIKTFGLTSTSSVSTIATAVGGVVDSAAAAAKAWNARPSADARELAKLSTQLDLAKTAGELEVLAATRSRAAEVAVLEQEKRIRDAVK